MRRFQQLVVGSLAGAAVFWLLATFGDASAKREAVAHGRVYNDDKPSKIVWVGLGASLGFSLAVVGPMLGVIRRHPRLAAVASGLSALFGANWVFWDAASKAEKIMEGANQRSESPGRYRPRDWKLAGSLPAAADDMLGIGPSRGRRCREPLSDGAYFDAVGAAAEQRLVDEYRHTGRLPGDFAS